MAKNYAKRNTKQWKKHIQETYGLGGSNFATSVVIVVKW